MLEQAAAGFPFGFHGREEIIEATYNCAFDLEQLLDSLGVAPMMREVVVLGIDAGDLWHAMVVLDDYADNPRGISLHDERDKIKQQPNTANEIGLVKDI